MNMLIYCLCCIYAEKQKATKDLNETRLITDCLFSKVKKRYKHSATIIQSDSYLIAVFT